jgi:leucyl/phenylalanyl-tRNA---protein transferase
MRGISLSSVTSEDVLKAYRLGYFPMADSRDSEDVFWVLPKYRGILPLDDFYLSQFMRRLLRNHSYTVTINKAFRACMEECRAVSTTREDSWINDQIVEVYCQLHKHGHAHSIEVWQGDTMVGGLYGVSIGGAFFGESMFSRVSNTSKLALAYLVARLKIGGYQLLDTQFITDHLASLGAVEIDKTSYQKILEDALAVDGDFYRLSDHCDGSTILQSITQTS